jgi:hypothetical protein
MGESILYIQRLCADRFECVWPITGSRTHQKMWDARLNEGSGLGSESPSRVVTLALQKKCTTSPDRRNIISLWRLL